MRTAHTLYELNHLIRTSIQDSMPDSYWVQAEIGGCSMRGGHCYLELVEKKEDSDQLRARARAMIWSNVWLMLKPYFEAQTGSELSVGQKILAEVRVDFHELYGMSLTILDIDPAYTVGEWAMRRKIVVERLRKEGVLDLNKDLHWPELPQRIAVISSPAAAGYEDFMHQLGNGGYVFYTRLFPASVQGAQAEASILAALDNILLYADCFDVVVLIRGGGSTSDLSCFDSYELASAVAQFPLPVLAGIGHERDISVVDMVAHTSVKTPTAAAECLLEAISLQAERLQNAISKLADYVRQYRYQETLRIQKQVLSLQQVVERSMWTKHQRLQQYRQRLSDASEKRIRTERHRIEIMTKDVLAFSPEWQLKRGFSITTCQGRILTSPEGIPEGTQIETKLKEGILLTKTIKQ